jgi:hypothetical protein
MKKALVHLSLMLLLAALLVPLVGCKKDEPAEETPAAASDANMGGSGAAMGTDMGSGAAMGTDMAATTAPMGSDMGSGSMGSDLAPAKQ